MKKNKQHFIKVKCHFEGPLYDITERNETNIKFLVIQV